MTARSPLPRRSRARHRGQQGMTLVETVLAMSLSTMMLLPIIGWARFAFEEQVATKQRNVSGTGLAMLRSHVQRDVTGSDAAFVAGAALVDCAGGDGAGGTPLLVVADGEMRRAYAVAPGTDGGSSLWRRTCAVPGGPTVQSIEVVSGVTPSATGVECPSTPEADGSCRRVTVRVTTPTLSQASLSARVRSDGVTTPSGDPSPEDLAPIVAVAASPTQAGRGQLVRFSSAGSADPRGGRLTYSWDLGDGTTSTQADPEHRYGAVGSYTAVLTATNDAGVPSTGFVVVDVGNRSPEAVVAEPDEGLTVTRGEPVQFSADGSNDDADADVGGRVVSHLWEFGDGTTSTDEDPVKAFTALSPAGGFVVRLTVTDDLGGTDTEQLRVVVANRAPTVTVAASPSAGAAPLAVTLTANVVDEPALATNPPLTYSWRLGDGVTSTSASPTITYTTNGLRTVELTVTDDAGEQATATTTVNVTRLPVAAFTLSPTTGRAPLAVAVTNTSSDPDGNARSWLWDFGDGSTSTARNPGTRSLNPDPTAEAFTGATLTVRLTVTDAFGGTSTATRTVTLTGAPVPGGLRTSRSGTNLTYRWNAASPNVNGYQVLVDHTNVACADRTLTVTSTSVTVAYGGSSTTGCVRQRHTFQVRSRDSVTGRWGAWSAPRRVN